MTKICDGARRGLVPAAVMLLGCGSALAQSAATTGETRASPLQQAADTSSGLAEIVVTATRRATNVQDVPIAITAISGDALKNRGITDPRQLSSLAPNLIVDQGQGIGQTHVSIRGQTSSSFGLNANSPAGIYLDDVFQPYQYGLGVQIFDLNRVEVLRGPQGTLFGRNTTAGSVNYYSATPTTRDEGYLTVDGGAGDFNRYSVEGAFNKPLDTDLAMRASFRAEHRDDYVKNLYNGSKLGNYTNYSGRVQIGWTPADTTVILKIYGVKNTGDGPIYIDRGYFRNPCLDGVGAFFLCDAAGNPTPLTNSSRKTYTDIPTFENYDSYGVTLKIEHQFGDYILTSITNAQEGHYGQAQDTDGELGDFFHSRQIASTGQLSQELRLATPADKPLSAILGVFAQLDRFHGNEVSISSETPVFLQNTNALLSRQHNLASAAFTSVTYKITDKLSLIGGARFTYERRKDRASQIFNFGAPGREITNDYLDANYALTQYDPALDIRQSSDARATFKRVTGDITANYKPNNALLFYARFATGFRSGGLYQAPAGSGSLFVTLKPESVNNYEVGFKSELFGRKVRLNADAYYTDYSDLQVQTANANASGLGFSNAAAARIKGVEADVQIAPVRGVVLSGSIGYNQALYRQFETLVSGLPVSLRGNSLPVAPRWTANLGASYDMPLGDGHHLRFDTNWSYHSRYYFDSTNVPTDAERHRFIGDLRLAFAGKEDHWEFAAYVHNVLNEDQRQFGYDLTWVSPTIYGPKRTYGGQATFRF